MDLKELADGMVFDKRGDLAALNRKSFDVASATRLDAMYTVQNREASYMKRIQKNDEVKKSAYAGDSYEIHVHAGTEDFNALAEKAGAELERMKERRAVASGSLFYF